MHTCLSPGGDAVFDHPAWSSLLLVGTQDGVVTLEETAAGWREAHRGLGGHHVCALIGEPVSGNYYAGTHDAGVFVSPDGRHWQPAGPGVEHPNVFSLASVRRPDGSVRLYAGTEPAALFESRDHGQSWQRLAGLEEASGHETWMFPAPPFIAHIKQIAIHPQDADHIYVCVEQGGLYSSADAGRTWTEHTAGMPNDAHRVLLHPTRPGRLFLANGFFFNRSDDGGRTWFEMKEQTQKIGYADPLVYHPRRPETMFVSGAFATPDTWVKGSANVSIARTDDGGDTWQYARGGLPAEFKPSVEAMTLEARGDACRVFIGNTSGEVWLTEDEGKQWRQIACDLPPVSKCFHADLINGKLDLTEVRIPDEIRELMEQMVQRQA
jgi:photosystem II stability/assembly factor-like uncharacterized protein